MRTPLRIFFQLTVLLTLLPLQTFPADGTGSASFATEKLSLSPSLNDLEHGILDRLKRVEEFKFIEQEAAKLGVRAWLFGGTAAGYAHYVKWDLQREHGDPRFQADRFDYDYTNIYRSTQDLDIVIDGNAEQAKALQNLLAQKYPHLQGSKTAWEVRLLTQDMGDKQAILNNPDFLNQHTDSNSTGLIEITRSKNGDSVVRDARDWNSKEPHFLKDVQDGALHYYYSPLHNSTKFAKEGRNPPILSAVRFLTKAFQYELKIRPEDLIQLKKVIDEFDPKRDTQNSYVSHWIEKNGKKLIQNAVNIEYAWNTLEKLGLRRKLIAVSNNVNNGDSLAWWMNKEPLRVKPLGQGSGKTARDLGLDIVAHETNNFLAYESITRAPTGDPNVLISRNGAAEEAAAFGDGFYTRIGKIGARGTGLTIRFHLDPDARESSDFTRAQDFVIVKNKAALKVIPESLNIDPVEYFRMLANKKAIGHEDRGIQEKLKRRIGNKIRSLDKLQQKEIMDLVRDSIDQVPPHKDPKFMHGDLPPAAKEWFDLPISREHPELVEKLLKNRAFDFAVAKNLNLQAHPEMIETLIDRSPGIVIGNILRNPTWTDPEIILKVVMRGFDDPKEFEFFDAVLRCPPWHDHPKLRELTSGEEPRFENLLPAAFGLSREDPRLLEKLLKSRAFDPVVIKWLTSAPHWEDHPEFLETLINRSPGLVIQNVLSKPILLDHPEIILKMVMKGFEDPFNYPYFDEILRSPHWRDHPKLRELTHGEVPQFKNLLPAAEEIYFWKPMKNGPVEYFRTLALFHSSMTRPYHWRNPEWQEKFLQRLETMKVQSVRSITPSQEKEISEIVKEIIQGGHLNNPALKDWFALPNAARYPEIVDPTAAHSKRVESTFQGSCVTRVLRKFFK